MNLNVQRVFFFFEHERLVIHPQCHSFWRCGLSREALSRSRQEERRTGAITGPLFVSSSRASLCPSWRCPVLSMSALWVNVFYWHHHGKILLGKGAWLGRNLSKRSSEFFWHYSVSIYWITMPCAPGVVHLLCARCVGAHLLMCFVALRVPCLVFQLSLRTAHWCFTVCKPHVSFKSVPPCPWKSECAGLWSSVAGKRSTRPQNSALDLASSTLNFEVRGFLLGKQGSELTFFSSVGKHVMVVDCRSGPTVSQGGELICMNSDAVVAEKAQKIN